MKKLLLSAGGTGGHFFPAISFAERFIEKGNSTKIYILTDQRCKKFITKDLFMKIFILEHHNKCFNLIDKIVFLYKNVILFFKTLSLIIRISPSCIVGFGGYTSVHALLVAKLLRIKIILYEANSVLGRVNKFFLKNATIIFLAFEKTQGIKKKHLHKVSYSGFLIREKIKRIKLQQCKFSWPHFNILIYGGSQGSGLFSKLIPEAISLLLKLNLNIKLKIFHQAPQKDVEKVKKLYKKLNIESVVTDFFYNLDKIYPITDLAILRSGSGSVAEISFLGISVFFIPLKNSKDDHQYFNAKVFSDQKFTWMYSEEEVSSRILAQEINRLFLLKKNNERDNLENPSSSINYSDQWIQKVLSVIK